MSSRSILAAGAAVLALVSASPSMAKDAKAPATASMSDFPPMNFGKQGIDVAGIDHTLKPGNDFNKYVNGKWIAATTIPPDRTSVGSFRLLGERSIQNVAAIINGLVKSDPAAGTQERRIVDAYDAFMDTRAINAAGLAPAQPYLKAIFQAPDLKSLVALFGKPGYPALIGGSVRVDSRNPQRYIVGIGFAGMGLPSRDYYLTDNAANRKVQEKYRQFLATMLGKAGYSDPATAAEAVYSFERKVALLEWPQAVMRNPDLTYHKLTREQLLALAPSFPMQAVLDSFRFGEQPDFLVSQIKPTARQAKQLGLTTKQLEKLGGGLPAMEHLLTTTPLATLKAYMAVRFLSAHASVLPSDIDNANFAFYGTVLAGQKEERPRWKRAVSAVDGELGEQVGKLYVEKYFPPASKARMLDLVHNLRRAYEQAISENDWLQPETKKLALKKLSTFLPLVGYPDKFKTYDGLVISPTDPLANSINASAWRQNYNRNKLGKPVDRHEWALLPQTANAYYTPIFNEIVFPAAILQPPFFNAKADPAVNYGAIGAVIGHEMGHGYDDSGSKYDASGKLDNWWTRKDRQHFDKLASEMVHLIDAYCPLDNGKTCLKGRQDLGETLADTVGLRMAYRAYHLSLHGKAAPVIDGLTGDQRFFLAFAQVWRGKETSATLRRRILADPHPPWPFRVNNSVRNVDAWYKAFNVKPGDKLYLPPDKRVHIWTNN